MPLQGPVARVEKGHKKQVEETVEELGRATRASCSLLSLASGEGPQVLGGERQPVGTQQQARNPHSSVEEALK